MSSLLLFQSWIQSSPVNSGPHFCIYGKEATPLFVYCSGFWLDSSSQTLPPVSYLTKLEAVSLAHGWSCGMCKWVALTIGQPKPLRDPAPPPCTDFLLHHSDCKNHRFPFVSLGCCNSFFPCRLQTWLCWNVSYWKDLYVRYCFFFFSYRWRYPSSFQLWVI